MVKHFLFYFCLLFPLWVKAQSVKPTPPFVAPLPENIAFNEIYSYKSDAGTSSPPSTPVSPQQASIAKYWASVNGPQTLEINVVKTGQIRRDSIHYSDGTSQEHWRDGDFRFKTYSGQPNYVYIYNPGMSNSGGTSAPKNNDPVDFDQLTWISLADFQYEEEKAGVKCFVYKQGDETAWIDESSRLPVAYAGSSVLISYTYPPAPSDPLKLPPLIVAKLQQLKNAWSGH